MYGVMYDVTLDYPDSYTNCGLVNMPSYILLNHMKWCYIHMVIPIPSSAIYSLPSPLQPSDL